MAAQTHWDIEIDSPVLPEDYRLAGCSWWYTQWRDEEECSVDGEGSGSPQAHFANGHLLEEWDSGHLGERACNPVAVDNTVNFQHSRGAPDLVLQKHMRTGRHDGHLGLHCTNASDYKRRTVLPVLQKNSEVEGEVRKDS
jgi:hypothetical protein